MRKKNIYFLIIASVLVITSGIIYFLIKEDNNMYENCVDKITTEIDFSEINQYTIGSENLRYILDNYGCECLRELDEISYSTHRTKNGSYLYFFYDKSNDNTILEFIIYRKDIDNQWINYIEEHTTSISDIQTKNPDFKLFNLDSIDYSWGYIVTAEGEKYKLIFKLNVDTLEIQEIQHENSTLFDQVLEIDKE